MRMWKSVAALFISCLLFGSHLFGPTPAAAAVDADQAALAAEFFEQLNGERAARGLPALSLDVDVSFGAFDYAETLAARQQLRHADTGLAEIIGWGNRMGVITVSYMNSPSHRHLIVDPNHDAVGIGVACDDNGRIWTVARFTRADTSKGTNQSSSLNPIATSQADGSTCGWAEAANAVSRLYRAYFLRSPDNGGLSYWVTRRLDGAQLNEISSSFAAAEEFRIRYGSLSDAGFVDLVYRNVMGRTADSGGAAYWRSRLRSGLSRGEMMTAFSESSEFRIRTGLD